MEGFRNQKEIDEPARLIVLLCFTLVIVVNDLRFWYILNYGNEMRH
jgi:hypothetical protein